VDQPTNDNHEKWYPTNKSDFTVNRIRTDKAMAKSKSDFTESRTRTDKAMVKSKKTKEQTYKPLHRKLKIDHQLKQLKI
jgi:hypothetical protein